MDAFTEAATFAGPGPCCYRYRKGGVERPDLQCPNRPEFTIRLKGEPPRKTRLACWEHLNQVFYQLQLLHGYNGEYILTVRQLTDAQGATEYV